MRWYVSLYDVNAYGIHTLQTYERYDDFETAQRALSRTTIDYPTQYYIIEHKVGMHAPKLSSTKPPKREQYTVNNKVKKALQVDADHNIGTILRRIRALRPNSELTTIQSIVHDIQFYNSVWTKAQRAYLYEELAKQPCCAKLLHAYDLAHSSSYYI